MHGATIKKLRILLGSCEQAS